MGLRRVLPLALLILLVPTAAEAQYRGYSSKVRKAIDKLAKDKSVTKEGKELIKKYTSWFRTHEVEQFH